MVKKLEKDLLSMDDDALILSRLNKDLLQQIKAGKSSYLLVQKTDLDDPSFKETLSECLQFLFRPRSTHLLLRHAS